MQCDQNGRFFNVLGDKFSNKSSPHTWWILDFIHNTIFELKTAVAVFWATFGKIGLLLILTSGHTAYLSKAFFCIQACLRSSMLSTYKSAVYRAYLYSCRWISISGLHQIGVEGWRDLRERGAVLRGGDPLQQSRERPLHRVPLHSGWKSQIKR